MNKSLQFSPEVRERAVRMVREVGAAHLKGQMNLFHCQIVECDLSHKLKTLLPTDKVGYLQIGGIGSAYHPAAPSPGGTHCALQ